MRICPNFKPRGLASTLVVSLTIGSVLDLASGAGAGLAIGSGLGPGFGRIGERAIGIDVSIGGRAFAAQEAPGAHRASPSPAPRIGTGPAAGRMSGAASGAGGAIGRGVAAAANATRSPTAADMLEGKYAPLNKTPAGQAAQGGGLPDAPAAASRRKAGGGAATPLPGTTPLPGLKPPGTGSQPAVPGFKPPGTGSQPAVPGFKPPGTGSMTARPGLLPPLPGRGKVVPPPPPLPGITPVEPLKPGTGSPMVAPGAPLGTSSVRILSDFVRYDRQSKQAIARGNVKIYQDDVVISTSEAQYDQQNKITNIRVPFELLQTRKDEPPTTLKGQALTAYHGSKHVVVERDVWLKREGNPAARPANPSRKEKLKTAFKKEETIISGDHMDYWTNTKDARFDGNVKFFQKEKFATADHALVDNKAKKVYMTDKVVLTQVKGDWLVRNDIIDASKPDKERDEALRETTVMTGDRLEVDQETNDAVMTGQLVTITQKGKRATGKRAEYNDRLQQITLTQNVRIAKDDGGWITADRAVFHTESEKFEAYGARGIQVETEFKLDENDKQGAR